MSQKCILSLALTLGLISFSCSKISLEPVKPERKVFTPRWIKNLDVAYSTGNLPIGLQSPAMADEFLYVGENSGIFHAYNRKNGRPIWKSDEGQAYHASPVVFKDKVLYGNVEGRLYARNRFNGELIYNIDLGSAVESEPVLYQGRLIVHTRNHKIVCLDAETGKVLWAYKRSVPFLTTLQRVSQPLVYKNRIYVGFADGFTVAFNLEEGAILWETKVVNGQKFIDVDTHPTIFDEKIVVGSQSGQMSILNPRSGFIERHLPYFIARAPLILEDQMIVGTTDGEVVFLNSGLKETHKMKVSEGGITSIAQWGEEFIVSTTSGELIAISIKSKEVLDTFHFGHSSSALFGTLVVEGDTLAAYSSRNRLYVFRR
jgi:outer membrane protein assembly factor BamB